MAEIKIAKIKMPDLQHEVILDNRDMGFPNLAKRVAEDAERTLIKSLMAKLQQNGVIKTEIHMNEDMTYGTVETSIDFSPWENQIRNETAREILAEIYEECFNQFGYLDYDALDKLKKKYTEDQT